MSSGNRLGCWEGLTFGIGPTTQPHADPDDEDALEAGWFPADDALHMVTYVGEHERLGDALADRHEGVYRAVRRPRAVPVCG